jgi:hypothetical protein
MTEVNQEIENIVSEMKAEKPFSVLDAIRGVKYPTGKVRVYLDGEAAARLEELHEDRKLEEAEGSLASAELNAILEEIETLEKQIKLTALVFHMRGVPPKVKRVIADAARRQFKIAKDDDEATIAEKQEGYNRNLTYELMRHSIIKVENADGTVDGHGWSYDEIAQLDDVLIESEFSKIDGLCAKLTRSSHVFDESLDADFLSKS